MQLVREGDGWAVIGGPSGRLWIGQLGLAATPIHFAFRAETRAAVEAFHKAALAAGGRDSGAPGLRPNYRPDQGRSSIEQDGGGEMDCGEELE